MSTSPKTNWRRHRSGGASAARGVEPDEAPAYFEIFRAEPDAIVPAERGADYLRALRKRWSIVVAVTGIAVAAALGSSLMAQKKYDATANVLLARSQLVSTLFQTGAQSLDPERDVNTNVEIVTSGTVALRVMTKLRLPMTVPQLLSEVKTATKGNSNVVGITVRDPVPARAALIANAFAAEYVAYENDTARAQFRQGVSSVQRQLDAMSPGDRRSPAGHQLAERLQQYEIAAGVDTAGVRMLDPALVPTSPATPRPKMAAIIALIVGLFFGSLVAIGLARRD
jgi:succinoglycan biosynthesis transport protein ExoP